MDLDLDLSINAELSCFLWHRLIVEILNLDLIFAFPLSKNQTLSALAQTSLLSLP